MSFSSKTDLLKLLPGIAACALVALGAHMLARIEAAWFGHAWLEPLVLAILLGAVCRSVWTPGPSWAPGISFTAKTVLEVAVALLGATISASAIMAEGWPLVLGVAALVPVALVVSYGIGRAMGVAPRVALLAATGNAICGNSAIAAAAPVIGATGSEVAAAIAFTAILGVVVVLVLPLALPLLHMSEVEYGALAGMTVYAVPQVLAAAAAGGGAAIQVGTIVKLVRVVMLGPVVFTLALLHRRGGANYLSFSKAVPWFIIAFGILMAMQSAGFIPDGLRIWAAQAATLLTVLAMAALGLQCDVRAVAQAGLRVSVAVSLSMIALAGMAYGLIVMLGIG